MKAMDFAEAHDKKLKLQDKKEQKKLCFIMMVNTKHGKNIMT